MSISLESHNSDAMFCELWKRTWSVFSEILQRSHSTLFFLDANRIFGHYDVIKVFEFWTKMMFFNDFLDRIS